jgi:hypothetical protein
VMALVDYLAGPNYQLSWSPELLTYPLETRGNPGCRLFD